MSVFGTKGMGEMWLAGLPAERRKIPLGENNREPRLWGSVTGLSPVRAGYELELVVGASALVSELLFSGSRVLRSVVPLNRKFNALLKAGLR